MCSINYQMTTAFRTPLLHYGCSRLKHMISAPFTKERPVRQSQLGPALLVVDDTMSIRELLIHTLRSLVPYIEVENLVRRDPSLIHALTGPVYIMGAEPDDVLVGRLPCLSAFCQP
jgi:hypothetical protein